jgi:tetratricopeptide (TPR) repeat protein
MKKFFTIILILTFAGAVAAQKPAAGDDDKKALEAAVTAPLNADKAALLEKFVAERPKSKFLQSARESLVVARAAYAEELLRAGKRDESFDLFSKAVADAPDPIPDKLFDGAIARFPSVLYWAGQRQAATELADTIEKKVSGNAAQLRSLAMFYLSIENGGRAKKLAESAIAIDPAASASYETLGLAERFNFNFDAAVAAYQKAVELDPSNTAAKLSLAEMLRAQAKPGESTEIYKAILAESPDDAAASAGLVLSLFDEGKRDEAETRLAEITAKDDKNFMLLANAAYWYAANGDGAKAQELAEKAIAIEPRYIWAHIALGKALIAQNDPVGAEKVLIAARRYANLPTLEFEIAAARYKAGFYREAAEELSKSFEIEDGKISTLLGRRVERRSDSFADLVGAERRASIFEPSSAISAEDDARIKALFAMTRAVDYGEPTEKVVAEANKFTAGDDRMNLYRKLYAADVILDKTDGAAKAVELAGDAIGKTDAALEAPSAGAAVMAGELYESRTLAEARGEFLIVPDVPKSTLSAILRGRVEDLAGRALYKQKKYDDALVRYRRAMTVLPPNSAWWRATLWHMGESLQAQGNGREALDAYVKSYKTDKPDVVKYGIVAALYEQMNGSRKGLETLIGENPLGPSESGVSANEKTPPPAEPVAAQKVPAFIPSKVPVASEQVAETSNDRPATPTEAKTDESKTDKLEGTINFSDVLRTETSNATEPKPTETSDLPVSENALASQTETAVNSDLSAVNIEPQTPETVDTENIPEESAAKNDENITSETEDTLTEASSAQTQLPVDETPPENTVEKNETTTDEPKPDEPETTTEKKPDLPFEPVVIVVGKTPVPEDKPKTDETGSTETESADAVQNESSANEDLQKAEPETTPQNETPSPTDETADNSETEKPVTSETEIPSENEAPENTADETKTEEIKADEAVIEQPKEDVSSDTPETGGTRERIVEGVAVKEETGETCDIYSSQDSVSILNVVGNIGILVGIEGVESKDIRVENGSPENIQVTLQPDISGFGGRAFFVIRSKTTRTGLFQVTFAGGCGGKTIPVTVR